MSCGRKSKRLVGMPGLGGVSLRSELCSKRRSASVDADEKNLNRKGAEIAKGWGGRGVSVFASFVIRPCGMRCAEGADSLMLSGHSVACGSVHRWERKGTWLRAVLSLFFVLPNYRITDLLKHRKRSFRGSAAPPGRPVKVVRKGRPKRESISVHRLPDFHHLHSGVRVV